MKVAVRSLAWLAFCASLAMAETGVIIPSDKQTPDPSELSLESMQVKIVIDNGHATVHLAEVFRNRTARVLEGTYSLNLPSGAAVSDFAVWDDVTRIPGVILERKRAGELYTQIRNEAIDPGLLQSGEVAESSAPGEAAHSSEFTVKTVPIPAYGYKRVEAEYRQEIPLNQLTSQFVLPLKTRARNSPAVAKVSIEVDVSSPQAMVLFKALGPSFPLKMESQTPHRVRGSFIGNRVSLNDDLTLNYTLANEKAPQVQAYRSGEASKPGYFEASTILQPLQAGPQTGQRTVLILFDASLSMQWEKLERSFQALEGTLRSLRPGDLFMVTVFNSEVASSSQQPEQATTGAIAKALEFVRGSRLRGGTNLQKAFESVFAQAGSNSHVVLLSDGELTEGTLSPARFGEWFDKAWFEIPSARRPHIYAFAIGDDANARLMQRLASHSGVYEQVGTTEPLDFKLSSFVRKIGLSPLDRAGLTVSARAETALVYRLGKDDFPGSRASWVGEYGKPGPAEFVVEAGSGDRTGRESARAQLPETNLEHGYLPATWARARVDALLDKIDREGEDRASIEEIIRLSREYHFVTPYTSFLAAPRALLRPRLIRPGDPILRVRTDSSVVSVVALFPFGLVKPLQFLKNEDIWQTRFLAPDDLADGAHAVRLILRDREGHVFREQKSFLISSHPPLVRVRLDNARVHAGAQLVLHVQASETTRTVSASLYGAVPLYLRWNEADKSNTGILSVPAALPAGRYSIHVAAEDMAHNVSHQEVPVEVLP